MKKANKENKIMCESCGFYFDKNLIYTQYVSGNKYCDKCISLGVRTQEIKKEVKPEEVDKMVEALFKTPPPQKKNRRERRHK